jgi:hypothetical protein
MSPGSVQAILITLNAFFSVCMHTSDACSAPTSRTQSTSTRALDCTPCGMWLLKAMRQQARDLLPVLAMMCAAALRKVAMLTDGDIEIKVWSGEPLALACGHAYFQFL